VTIAATLAETLRQAVEHHRAGRLAEAEQLYRAILQVQPRQPDANHNLGALASSVGNYRAALPFLKAALAAGPDVAQYWLSYVAALIAAGETKKAKRLLDAPPRQAAADVGVLRDRLKMARKASAVPAYPADHDERQQLVALYRAGRFEEVAALARRWLERVPGEALAWNALWSSLASLGRFEAALPAVMKTVELLPRNADAHCNLGGVLNQLGRYPEAEAACRRAIAIEPDYAMAQSNLGHALNRLARNDEAEAACRRAIELSPGLIEAHNNLGCVLKDTGRYGEAEALFRQVIAARPDFAEAHGNLGGVLADVARHQEAEAAFRRAIELKPDHADAHSSLLLSQCYTAMTPTPDMIENARRFGALVRGRVPAPFGDWSCDMAPSRLRIGFVSGDLRNHPVGYFLEAFLAHLDRSRIEPVAYSNHSRRDDLTARLEPYFAQWRSIDGLGDEAVARLIREDGIHILFDLSGHTAHNRLAVFAWKPAAVQASWLGYFATTGVAEIDYVLCDPHVAPPGEERHFTETLWRLPECYLCFTPPEAAPAVAPLPALRHGAVTFGCFNNLSKINDAVIALWAGVLTAVPDSRLFLKNRQLADESLREQLRARFVRLGIAGTRLRLEAPSPRREYLAAYGEVDIALDPFPYTGGTISAEGLWMGVPVLTQRGDHFVANMGASIAHNVGLADWIAADGDDYVRKATAFASDPHALARLRAGLRAQAATSPLLDAQRFARHWQDAVWAMWRRPAS
jgi:predicted O-linked N-acetylglucosamine transferase (SPINDLY family)